MIIAVTRNELVSRIVKANGTIFHSQFRSVYFDEILYLNKLKR